MLNTTVVNSLALVGCSAVKWQKAHLIPTDFLSSIKSNPAGNINPKTNVIE